eukprot:scaffold211840_cov31-Tisochrysis_lutea.AAC.1
MSATSSLCLVFGHRCACAKLSADCGAHRRVTLTLSGDTTYWSLLRSKLSIASRITSNEGRRSGISCQHSCISSTSCGGRSMSIGMLGRGSMPVMTPTIILSATVLA